MTAPYHAPSSPHRPSWDEYFMQIAFTVAEGSTCDRAYVGAVLVRDRRILVTGYNGAPAGLPHCDDVGHLMIDNHCVFLSQAGITLDHLPRLRSADSVYQPD